MNLAGGRTQKEEGRLDESSDWIRFFERLLLYFSGPKFENEILSAKAVFFEKLGRSHETREDHFDSVSQSFLEWYIFDFRLKPSRKAPAVYFLQNRLGSEEDQKKLSSALFHHWSLFEVIRPLSGHVLIKDLLFDQERSLKFDVENPSFRVWRPEAGQIIQARCFHAGEGHRTFATHVWLHASSEAETLKNLAARRAKLWGLHREFLRDCLEALVRSLSLRDQMRAVNARNWIYQELNKKYAPKN